LQIKRFNYVPQPNGLPRALIKRERERLMGFPEGHLDGYGNMNIPPSDLQGARFIGDSFQVDTMAYILSPLKAMQVHAANHNQNHDKDTTQLV
jgi:site-specific DNA-cytosine methylase